MYMYFHTKDNYSISNNLHEIKSQTNRKKHNWRKENTVAAKNVQRLSNCTLLKEHKYTFYAV